MKAVFLLAYLAMAVWLLIAAALRVYLQLSQGLPLDVLPFISGSLGLLALLVLAPAFNEWRERHPARREGDASSPIG